MYGSMLKFLIYGISGMMLAKASENKKGASKHNLPNFKGILEVKHSLPGRIRLYIPKLKENQQNIDNLFSQLSRIDAFASTEINPITGTVLIQYDVKKIEPLIIVGILIKLLALENIVEQEPTSAVKKELNAMEASLRRAVYEKTGGILDYETLFFFLLSGLGIYRLKTRPDMMPGGITLLWWAYSSFLKGGSHKGV